MRRDLFENLAWTLGIDYPPSLLVLGLIVFGLIVAVHFSLKISLLEQRVTRLAQELSIMESKLESGEAARQEAGAQARAAESQDLAKRDAQDVCQKIVG